MNENEGDNNPVVRHPIIAELTEQRRCYLCTSHKRGSGGILRKRAQPWKLCGECFSWLVGTLKEGGMHPVVESSPE